MESADRLLVTTVICFFNFTSSSARIELVVPAFKAIIFPE